MKNYLIFLLILLGLSNLHGQQYIKGIISDFEGNIIKNATLINITDKQNVSLSDASGYFEIPCKRDIIYINRYIIKSLGYQTLDTLLECQDSLIYINLKSDTLNEIVISTSKKQYLSGSYNISTKSLVNQPILFGEPDMNKMLQTIPGVNFSIEGSGDLIVRGGGINENLYLLDGDEIYLNAHLFGFISPLNMDLIKELIFYNGNFPANFSGKISSFINLKTHFERIVKRSTKLSTGLLSSSIFHSRMLTNKLSLMGSFRISNVNLILRPLYFFIDPQEKIIPGFYDTFIKVGYQMNTKSSFNFKYFRSQDNFLTSFERNSKSVFSSDVQKDKWTNNFININYSFNDNNFNYNSSLGYSDYLTTNSYSSTIISNKDTSSFIYNYQTNNRLFRLRNEIELKLPFFKLNAGSLVSIRNIKLLENDNSAIDQYAQKGDYINNHLMITVRHPRSSSFIGTNLLSFPTLGFKTMIEPRIYLNYRFDNSEIYGSFSIVNQYDHLLSNRTLGNYLKINILGDPKDNPLAKSEILNLGHKFNYKKIQFRTEIYKKKRSNLLRINEGDLLFVNSTNIKNLIGNGTGNSYGLEIGMSSRLNNKSKVNLSYVLSSSKVQFTNLNSDMEFYDDFDRRHNIKLNYDFKLSTKWSFSSSFVFLSGSPFTAYESVYPGLSYDFEDSSTGNSQGNLLFYFESLNNVRLPNYHRLDCAFQKVVKINNRKSVLKFGVYNIYARRNSFIVRLREDIPKNSLDTESQKLKYESESYFNFIPFITYSIIFNEN